MDKYFELNETEFEWDEEKYRLNVRKHGVKFEEAAEYSLTPKIDSVTRRSRTSFASSSLVILETGASFSLSFWNGRFALELSLRDERRQRRDCLIKNRKINEDDEISDLALYPQTYEPILVSNSADVLEVLNKKASEREMTLEARIKLYIAQGLREDLTAPEAKALLVKKLRSRKGSPRSDKNLAA
jgi:hypothetical protein